MNRPAPHHRPRERGVTLVWVALLALGLFGLLGAAVDLGLARLAQQQMQAATDTAALEGLRWRDAVGDAGRRVLAAALVESALPDGVGPAIGVRGGATAGELGLLDVDDARFVAARPAANPDNDPAGDLVAGALRGDPLRGGLPPNRQGIEDGKYARADFDPADADAAATADAFLVRLRRTRDDLGLDRIPGVSSGGPPLPWLFGLGSLLDAGSRRRGITVRATSLAGAVPAVAVSWSPEHEVLGLPRTATDRLGGFVLFPEQVPGWTPSAPPAELHLDIAADGTLRPYAAPGPLDEVREQAHGRACSFLPIDTTLAVGDRVEPRTGFPLPAGEIAVLIPLAVRRADATATGEFVVGFRRGTVRPDVDTERTLRLRLFPDSIVPRGATSVMPRAHAALGASPTLAAAFLQWGGGVRHATLVR